MRLNKKGFTLVELLAVIVVLAIIALIGFTAVGPVIEDSRKNAAKSNLLEYVHTLETGCAAAQIEKAATEITMGEALQKVPFSKETKPTLKGNGIAATTSSKIFNENCNIKPEYNVAESNERSCTISNSEINCR